jgi:hypothetical protein
MLEVSRPEPAQAEQVNVLNEHPKSVQPEHEVVHPEQPPKPTNVVTPDAPRLWRRIMSRR